MDRNHIVALPHARLREKSQRVSNFDGNLAKLITDMRDASLDWEDHRKHEFCVGLAASQVDKLIRVVILRKNLEDRSDKEFTALVNPKLIKTYGEPEEDFEGCLSVSDIYVKVPRYPKVKIKAFNEKGEEFRLTAEGFQARLLQHEIDHTNGIMIVDRVKDAPEAFYKLDEDGKIVPLDYEKDVKDNHELWG